MHTSAAAAAAAEWQHGNKAKAMPIQFNPIWLYCTTARNLLSVCLVKLACLSWPKLRQNRPHIFSVGETSAPRPSRSSYSVCLPSSLGALASNVSSVFAEAGVSLLLLLLPCFKHALPQSGKLIELTSPPVSDVIDYLCVHAPSLQPDWSTLSSLSIAVHVPAVMSKRTL